MTITIYLIFALLYIVVGIIYFSRFIFRFIKEFKNKELDKKQRILVIVIISIISLSSMNIFSIFSNVYMHILVISGIYELLNYILKKYKVYRYMLYSGALAIITTILILGYGYYNMNNVIETEYLIESSKINNLRILQISDLHMSNSVTVEELETYVEEVNNLNVDIVALTGDLFDESTPLKDMKDACKILGNISNKLGIYFVYGNHDANRYGSNKTFNHNDVKKELEKNGIVVLEDEVVTIDNISIIGRKDAGWSSDKTNREDMKDLIKNTDDNDYIIVLDHRPIDLDINAELGVDLQLSGHTHGGQYFPAGPIEALFTGKLMYGKREIGKFNAITSSGISGWGAPLKTGAPSEYVLITVN